MGRVLISGGAGFLGSHLCDFLIERGHDVVAVDNFVSGQRRNVVHLSGGVAAGLGDNPKFTLLERDVSEPFAIEGPINYVMHLASPASPADFKKIPIETLRAGSYGTHVMLDLARAKGACFFLASTSEVYGDPPPEHHPQKETYWGHVNPNGPRSVYDEAKRYAEAVTMAYHREYGLDTRIVRIFNTYGPRMRPDDGRVVTNLIAQALQGEPLTLYGDGSQTRSFCYVSDLIDGFYRLLLSGEHDPVNIGNPVELSMRALAEIILRLTGSSSPIVTIPLPFSDDPKQRRPDITKAKQLLGWEPRVSLEEGLEPTIAYLRSERTLA